MTLDDDRRHNILLIPVSVRRAPAEDSDQWALRDVGKS